MVYWVFVTSDPFPADVYLDGNYYGKTYIFVYNLTGSHTITVKKDGYKDWEKDIDENDAGKTIFVELEEEIQGIRCALGAEYSVPSGTHPFNLWVLYGTDVDGTYENFASEGPSQWGGGVQVNIGSPGQSIVTNLNLSNITLPSGTYDSITIIVDGINTSIVYDWKIDNSVLTI